MRPFGFLVQHVGFRCEIKRVFQQLKVVLCHNQLTIYRLTRSDYGGHSVKKDKDSVYVLHLKWRLRRQ